MVPYVAEASLGRGCAVHCLGLFRFVSFCSCEGKAVTCYDLLCIASLRFALHGPALLCIILLICGMTKKKTKHMLLCMLKTSPKHAKRMLKAS